MKKLIIGLAVIIIIGLGIYFINKSLSNNASVATNTPPEEQNATITEKQKNTEETVIGKSVEGRDIIAYHYLSAQASSTAEKEILFVGGIHGGYEWNTALVAYQLINYIKANPSVIPDNIKVTVVPVLNPDGLNKIVGTTTGNFTQSDVPSLLSDTVPGRFNANNVDLNRNFDCDWQAKAKWQNKDVSGGSAVFSEPESLAMKNYVETSKPVAVVVWYSSAGGVYASSCHNGVSPETNTITDVYAKASGYPAYQDFDFYAITGDMVNWLAKKNIPAVSVLLTNHTDTEWSKNQKGIDALLKYYSQK
ncbi:MAG: M14 family zinc carboxypeptidase [Candidatus Zambryskibacteria bacterium]